MKKVLIVLIAVMLSMFTVISLTACSTPNSMLEDTKWFLRSYDVQDNLEAIIEDTVITVIELTSTYETLTFLDIIK